MNPATLLFRQVPIHIAMAAIIACAGAYAASTAEELCERAEALLKASPPEALTLAKQAVALEPKNARAHELLARCLRATGNKAEALKEASAALRIAPYDGAFFTRGELNEKAGNFPEALSDFSNALKTLPHNSSVKTHHAICLTHLGKLKEAMSEFNEVVAKNPKFSSGYLYRANARVKLNDIDGEIADLKSFCQLEPTDQYVVPRLTDVFATHKRFDEALAFWRDLSKHSRTFLVTISYGDALMRDGQTDEGLKQWRRGIDLLEQEPRLGSVEANTIRSYLATMQATGNPGEGIRVANLWLKRAADPDFLAELHLMKSEFYTDLRDFKHAGAELAEAKRLGVGQHKPKLTELEAKVLFARGKLKESKAVCNQGLKSDPDNLALMHMRAHANDKLGLNAEALADYTSVLRRQPNHASDLESRAILYRQMRKFKESLADYVRLEKLLPKRANVYKLQQAQLYERLAEFKKAAEAYAYLGTKTAGSGELHYRAADNFDLAKMPEQGAAQRQLGDRQLEAVGK